MKIETIYGELTYEGGMVIDKTPAGIDNAWSVADFLYMYDLNRIPRHLLERIYGSEKMEKFVENLKNDLT